MKRILPTVAVLAAALSPRISCGEASQWTKVDEGKTGNRAGSVLLYAADQQRMFLVGPGAPCVQAFDPAAKTWSDVAAAAPGGKDSFHPYYQAAYDPGTKSIYCLSGGAVLYVFSLDEKTWKTQPPARGLEGLSWHAMACDAAGKRLVVVGSDKRLDNLGWLRTVVYDIPAGTWTRLDVADAKVVQEHKHIVAAKEAIIDLVGGIRLAWYRDPKGVGTETEVKALVERCDAAKKLPQAPAFAAELDAVAELLRGQKTLDALRAARALQRKMEEAAEAQYPVPCSRRNSPLVFDEKNKVFVLFGGDHEDYLINDTWVLDIEKKTWRRAKPEKAPAPRAGHALCFLPKSGKVAMYEGYAQSDNTDYGAIPYKPRSTLELWVYDAAADRWELVEARVLPAKAGGAFAGPMPLGAFDGYARQYYCPPALAAEANDQLVLAGHAPPEGAKRPCETWTLALPPTPLLSKEGEAPNQRQYRAGEFQASFCETAAEPKGTGLEQLAANRWTKLPAAPRNPCRGCRQRDWGTCVWDSDREQILHWGGGHCVRSASTVAHFSPVSGRIVEGFDADEPYGANGGGAFDSSVLNRPWVSTHNYNHYAYDPKCKLLVAARGYLYDPERMDWLRMEPIARPFQFEWGCTVVETSPHGAVAWAKKKKGDDAGLWLFDREQGWSDLEPKGKLFVPYCDAHGMVYDSKRDRMLISGVGGGYQKKSSGAFLAFDFAAKALETVMPENAEWNKTRNAREMAYVDHADWVLIGELVPQHEQKAAKHYTRVYDCAKNRMFLLDAGDVPDCHSTGWMYDAKRKLVYVFTHHGEAWALKLDPASAALVEKPPE